MTDQEINDALWSVVWKAKDLLARHDRCPDCWPHVDRCELIEALKQVPPRDPGFAMRTEKEIRGRLEQEILRLGTSKGHLQSIAGGWVDALEWVLGANE